jgi:hypothetical protein
MSEIPTNDQKLVTKLPPCHKAYWSNNSGLWHCEKCSIIGDKFAMQNGYCSMSKKGKKKS